MNLPLIMSESSFKWNGEKFDGKDLDNWDMLLQIVLRRHKVAGIVHNEIPKPTKSDAEIARLDTTGKVAWEKTILDWEEKDGKALEIIVSSVGPKVLTHIRLAVRLKEQTSY